MDEPRNTIESMQNEIRKLLFQNTPLNTIPTSFINEYISLIKEKEHINNDSDFDEDTIKKYKYLAELAQIRNERFFNNFNS